MEALKEEFSRQKKPADPERDFQALETHNPSAAVQNCERLLTLAKYLELGDVAVKHRLFNSLSTTLKNSVVVWMNMNGRATARELANFISTFPAQENGDIVTNSTCPDLSAAAISKLNCEECGKLGHTKRSCFKLKTCYRCGKKGHIQSFCRATKCFDNQKN